MQINVHKINWRRVLIIAGIILLILLTVGYCSQKKENERLRDNEKISNQTIQHYKLGNGKLVATNQTLIYDNKQLKELVIEKDADLKEISKKFSRVTGVSVVSAKSDFSGISIAHEGGPVTIANPCDSTKAPIKVTFRKKGIVNEEWYGMVYTVTQDSLHVDHFTSWTELKRVDGFKKKWIFGKTYLTSDITSTNPYVHVDNVQTIMVKVPVPFYDTRLFNVGVGLLAGYLIFK